MDAGSLLLRLFVVLVAARIAAEAAVRLRQPAVLAEIAAGIIVGPSLLGLVHRDEILTSLGELGAILLLFQVGMHMNIADLRRVGGASLRVALIGIAAPMAGGYAVVRAMGVDGPEALFLAAAITATSVGITARAFADLRALATPEARMVLGAAVADDVAGLLILTIVLRVAGGEAVTAGTLAGVLGAALAFVILGTAVAVAVVPVVLSRVSDRARAEGTLLVVGVALAIGVAGVASWAKLAPIVGAFVAGVAVASSPSADDLERRLAPIGHLLIPVFFLSMGVDTSLNAFADGRALAIAAGLIVVGIGGKLISGMGVRAGTADRTLVGIGMVPRGEVGLIFAGLGLSEGILDSRLHAALLIVVLATTVVTPPWLRARTRRLRRAAVGEASVIEPPGGWLVVSPDEVELSPALSGEPPVSLAAAIGLDAALACATRRPGARLLAWLSSLPPEPKAWDEAIRSRFVSLLLAGTSRSWRFLEVSGLLGWMLPDLEKALHRRAIDPFDLEQPGTVRLPDLEDLVVMIRSSTDDAVDVWSAMEQRELVVIAALARSAFPERGAATAATRLASSLGLPPDDVDMVSFLVAERHLLPAASARLDLGTENAVLELAAHAVTRDRVDGLYVLSAAGEVEPAEREALRELRQLLVEVLAHPELVGEVATDILEARRLDVLAALEGVLPRGVVEDRLDAVPRRYLLSQSAASIARHLRMTETRPVRGELRLEAEPAEGRDRWFLHVVFLDRRGALGAVAGALTAGDVAVEEAFIATWNHGIAVDVFRVRAEPGTDWEAVRRAIEKSLKAPAAGVLEAIDAEVSFDDRASPWQTIVELRASDRRGLLARVATALGRAGAEIHLATVATRDGVAVDSFHVTGKRGGKLDASEQRAVRAALAGRIVGRLRPVFAAGLGRLSAAETLRE